MSGALITCPACGAETFLKREPVFTGFQRTGETLSCVACGHRFASEEDVPFVQQARPQIFSDADRSVKPQIFSGDQPSPR